MASRDDIVTWANDYLGVHNVEDMGPMGLQFPGRGNVSMVATGVTASVKLFRHAREWGADMLVVHHGIFFNPANRDINMSLVADRLFWLDAYQMSLLGYHLCLDQHPEIGNNVSLAEKIGAVVLDTWNDNGINAYIPEGATKSDIDSIFPDGNTFMYGPDEIRSVAICTGGAPQYLEQAVVDGFDLYITGEARENNQEEAREYWINFIAGGHYNTEIDGVRRLGQKIEEQFGVEHRFIDVPNPV